MSCYIMAGKDIRTIAHWFASQRKQEFPRDFRKQLERCEINGIVDEHRLYRMLSIYNIMAWNGRYEDENVREFEAYEKTESKYNPDPDFEEFKDLFGCYVYQVSEAPVDRTDFYDSLISIQQFLGD